MTQDEIEKIIENKVSIELKKIRKFFINVIIAMGSVIVLQVAGFIYERGSISVTVKRNAEDNKRNAEDIRAYAKSTAEYNASVNAAIGKLTEVAIENKAKIEANEKTIDRYIDINP